MPKPCPRLLVTDCGKPLLILETGSIQLNAPYRKLIRYPEFPRIDGMLHVL
jgi:hypothetical protein